MDTNERGREIERRVRDHLVERGLEPLGGNWCRRVGELDLIMRERTPDGVTIVFVEVRYRRHHAFGGAPASVDAGKRARLRRAALAWLQRHADADQTARIDVVAVGPSPPPGTSDGCRGGRVFPLGEDARGHPLSLEWIVNAVEDEG